MIKEFYIDDFYTIKGSITLTGLFVDLRKNGLPVDFTIKGTNKIVLNEKIDLAADYQLKINHSNYEIIPRHINEDPGYLKLLDIDLKQFGSFVRDGKTIFRTFAVFARSCSVVIDGCVYPMQRYDGFCFETIIDKDMSDCFYHYECERSGIYVHFKDPFSYRDRNDFDSIVTNIEKYRFKKYKLKPIKKEDIIIYEASVRDMTSDNAVSFDYPRRFKGLCETDRYYKSSKAGIDHVLSLGVTHLQLLPVFEYDLDRTDYNWGYNPKTYNTFDRGYTVDDGIKEFGDLVSFLHSKGLRVVTDVVYNHVFRFKNFALHKMVPYLPYRFENNKLANGSYCGTEMATERTLMRTYLKLITERLVSIYDIDGLRFDLMGLIDIQTIKEIEDNCRLYKKDFVCYGEGWNMGRCLKDSEKAMIQNSKKMGDVFMFSDRFRDDVISYVEGNEEIEDIIKYRLNGSTFDLDRHSSLNYVECHDNYTLYDRLKAHDETIDESELKKKCLFALSLIMIARGVPFIHAGQEFLRSKHGVENSYNRSDEINMMDWSLCYRNKDCVDYVRSLIALRKLLPNNKEFVYEARDDLLVARVGEYTIYINASAEDRYIDLENNTIGIFNRKGLHFFDGNSQKIDSFSILVTK